MLYSLYNYIDCYTLGIHSVRVALLAEKAEISYMSGVIDPDQIVSMIGSLGFGAKILSLDGNSEGGKVDLEVQYYYYIIINVIIIIVIIVLSCIYFLSIEWYSIS